MDTEWSRMHPLAWHPSVPPGLCSLLAGCPSTDAPDVTSAPADGLGLLPVGVIVKKAAVNIHVELLVLT